MTAEEIMNVVMPAVCAQLKAPSSARFPTELITIVGNDVDGYQVDGFVDSQNSYGAMIRNDFSANVVIQNNTPFVTKATVAAKANKERIKNFGLSYVAISIIVGILALVGTGLLSLMVNLFF